MYPHVSWFKAILVSSCFSTRGSRYIFRRSEKIPIRVKSPHGSVNGETFWVPTPGFVTRPGKRTNITLHNYRKSSPFLLGKSTISMENYNITIWKIITIL